MAFARMQAIIAALLFSTGGAAIKGASCGALSLAGGRSLIAALFLLLVIPTARKSLGKGAAIVGVAQGATLLLFVLANTLTLAANTSFLQGSSPLYVLLLAPRLLGERASRRDFLLAVPFALGLGLILFGTPSAQESAPEPVLGNLLAALCGFSWALTLIGLRFLGRGGDRSSASTHALAAVVIGNLIAGVVAVPLAFAAGEEIAWGDAAIIAYLGFVQVGLAYLLLVRSLTRLPAYEISLLFLLEPVLSPLWTWIIHGERVGFQTLGGGALILSGLLAQALRNRRRIRGPSP